MQYLTHLSVVTIIARLTSIFNSAQKRQHGKETEFLFKKHREKKSVEKNSLSLKTNRKYTKYTVTNLLASRLSKEGKALLSVDRSNLLGYAV